jgi:hypothetical protein
VCVCFESREKRRLREQKGAADSAAAGSFSSAEMAAITARPEDEWSRFGKYSLKTMIPN